MASVIPQKRILFFTNSDYGQANVVLATIYELMLAVAQAQIHIASFQALQPAVEDTIKLAEEKASGKQSARVVFHRLEGRSQFEAATGPDIDIFEAYDRPVNFINAAHTILSIDGIMQPWSPEEFASLYRQSMGIHNDVKPELTIVEPLFTPASTMCNHVRLNWIVLSPNTIKDFALPLQPRLAPLWKYPMSVHLEFEASLSTLFIHTDVRSVVFALDFPSRSQSHSSPRTLRLVLLQRTCSSRARGSGRRRHT